MALIEVIEKHKVTILGQEITYTNKFIKHIEGTTYSFKPQSSLVSCSSRLFKYEYEHAYLSPTLFIDNKGNKFIMPTNQKVHSKTTYKDIEWIQPEKVKPVVEKNTWKFESSSEKGLFYTVRQNGLRLSCNCQGVWRSKDRRCKHIKEVEQKLK